MTAMTAMTAVHRRRGSIPGAQLTGSRRNSVFQVGSGRLCILVVVCAVVVFHQGRIAMVEIDNAMSYQVLFIMEMCLFWWDT